MSVDGTVLCDCLETGVATPPPHPVYRDSRWVHAVGDDPRAPAQADVRAWAETACQHPQFWLVEHQVLQMSMLGAMAEYGGEAEFPAIHAAMPKGNWGEVEPADSARCLAELDRLGALMAHRSMTVIVDRDDDGIVFVDPHSRLVSGSRAYSPGWSVVTHDARGAVVRDPDTPVVGLDTSTWLGDDGVVRVLDADGMELFAAREFEQDHDGESWLFRDGAAVVRHCSPISHWSEPSDRVWPRRFRAEIRPVDVDHYFAGVAGLRELFATSVLTGRPVIWS
jgi:hypothetical protein